MKVGGHGVLAALAPQLIGGRCSVAQALQAVRWPIENED